MLRILLISFVFILVEFYTYQAFRQWTKRKSFRLIYILVSILILAYIAYGFSKFNRSTGQTHQSMLAAALVILFYLPKAIITILLLIEDLLRLSVGIFQYFKQEQAGKEANKPFIPERRKFVSQLALGMAAIPFASVLYGITVGRYKFQIHKHVLEFADLPDAFDGFTFTQLSDIHAGSFDNKEKLEYAVDLINSQDSDLLLFTGDIVNSIADEMLPWADVFKKLRKHAYGNYSVLGNHDYGEYVNWDTEEEKLANFKEICDISPKIGFQLLRNECVKIDKGGESIFVVGVENWGADKRFMKYGDLDKATQGISASDFKILMTHDPSHWDAQVLDHPKNFQLTLAGHTHGFQFGIEIPGIIKWSPVQYIYKQWAGLYEKMEKYIYVNRGFGYHAYQGRTGIWPEITLIELRKKK